MDEIDKYIKKIVTKKIEEPPSFEKAIREALYSEKFYKRMRKRKIIKTISTACAAVVLTSGVAVGGFITYEKVWKEPKQYTYEELKNTIAQSEVPEEEKANLISEDDAKNKALEIVNNLGYENQEITKIELNQNKEEYINEIYYKIETSDKNKNLNIKIDAKTGELESFEDIGLLQKENNNEEINSEEAIEIVKSIYEDIGVNIDDYILKKCNKENIAYRGENKEVWNIESYKQYNGIINPYEEINLKFIMNSQKVQISSISFIKDGIYENNPAVITKEEAMEIATEKEKQLTNNNISEIQATRGIEKVNNFIIELEENIVNIDEEKKQNKEKININMVNTRNVWLVEIKHNEEKYNQEEKTRLKSKNKIYFVDITTGEIIGGKYLEED